MHFGSIEASFQNQGKIWGLVSFLKAKNTLEELDVLRFFEFKVEEFPYKTFFYDYDDLKAINKSGYTEHYLGKCIAKCFFRLSKVFFHQEKNGSQKYSLLFNIIPPIHGIIHHFTQYLNHYLLISKSRQTDISRSFSNL